jgi:hypothetical protein
MRHAKAKIHFLFRTCSFVLANQLKLWTLEFSKWYPAWSARTFPVNCWRATNERGARFVNIVADSQPVHPDKIQNDSWYLSV